MCIAVCECQITPKNMDFWAYTNHSPPNRVLLKQVSYTKVHETKDLVIGKNKFTGSTNHQLPTNQHHDVTKQHDGLDTGGIDLPNINAKLGLNTNQSTTEETSKDQFP
jgi:hypothetical protein